MSIDIPGAPIRPKTPIINKFGKVIKRKTEDEEGTDPKTVAVIDKTMPEYKYVPTLHEIIMMYTKAVKIESLTRKKPTKTKKKKNTSTEL